jgi:FkbM family methyltransferase
LKARTYPARYRIASAIFPGAGRFGPDARASFSGAGEDIVALSWLSHHGISPADMRYLDVGAADPVVLSNTYLFSTHGASGVLVEPDPDQAEKLKVRTRDVVINAGVAFDERRSATLTRFSTPFFNTFLDSQSDAVLRQSRDWAQAQSVVDRIEVPLVDINTIMEKYFGGTAPHFLSIDAESVDYQILKSLDFSRYRPIVICMECMRPVQDLETVLGPHGYQLVCRTPDNAIFYRPGSSR